MKIKANYANAPTWKELTIKSSLPAELQCLDEIAHNLWWSWNYEARDLWRSLDRELFEKCGENPVLLLEKLPYECKEAAANNKKHIKNNKKKVQKTALEEKVTEQANKDLTVITKGYDFKISLFESQKDMSYYRFNKNVFDMKAVKNAANKKIKEAQQAHKEALKYEERDNGRYYAVITNDPVTMKCNKRKADRVKIASIRTQMMTLLNKRDELNSKLLSIYNGSEVTLDGVSVNQKWRSVRSDAAEKFINKNQKLAKQIFRLPASSGEKQRLYGVLNSSVEASSNLALSEYRLKTKEYKSAEEKKALQADIKAMKNLMAQNSKDIAWVIKQIQKRK